MSRLTLYVSEHCRYCEGAHDTIKRLSAEFDVPYDVVSVDEHPQQGVPAVPAVLYQGVLHIGVNFPRRLRAILETSLNLEGVNSHGVL